MRIHLIALCSLVLTGTALASPETLKESYQEGLIYHLMAVNESINSNDTDRLDLTTVQSTPATFGQWYGMSPNGVYDCGNYHCLVTKVSFSDLEASLGITYKKQVFSFLGQFSVLHDGITEPTDLIVDVVIDDINSTVDFYTPSIYGHPTSVAIADFIPSLSYQDNNEALNSLKELHKEGVLLQSIAISESFINGDTEKLNLRKTQQAFATYEQWYGVSPNGVYDCGNYHCLVTKVSFSDLKDSLGIDYMKQVFTFPGQFSVLHGSITRPTGSIIDITIDNVNSTVNFFSPSIYGYPSNGDIASFIPVSLYEKPSTPAVSLYQHSYFEGYSVLLSEGEYQLKELIDKGMLNDDISSLRVSDGYILKVYEHSDFTGWVREYSKDTPWVGFFENDKISSVKVIKLR